MRRVSRYLFTFAAAASLLLCLAALGLGVWSYRVGRLIKWGSSRLETPLRIVERRHVVGVSRGTFVYSLTTVRSDYRDPLLASDALESRRASTTQQFDVVVFVPTPPRFAKHRVVDLKVLRYAVLEQPRHSERAVLVPLWMVAPLLAVLPAFWAVRHRRRRILRHRAAAGQCLRCGYDLRAQKPGDPCPECGQPAARLPHASRDAPGL